MAGAVVGLVSGGSAGVYWVGNRANETGSFASTALGFVVGGALVTALIQDAETGDEDALVIPAILLPPIGAAVGFNATRRYDTPPTAFAPARDNDPTSISRRGNARRFAANVLSARF